MAKDGVNHNGEVFDSDKYDSGIKEVDLSTEMKSSFLDYSMSVIVSRALPDVKDGFKPVHRRIVYTMNDMGITYTVAHKKSARIVGEVMGKYHPHGDSAIYLAMVRLAQDFNYRYPLVDGHGNFGDIDGHEPAAMRYTEARLSKIAGELVRDINKDTVDFVPNYDGEDQEPSVLPCRIPNLLINGSTGIAVGMATNIPPHNLGEVIDATLAVADNPEISIAELMNNYIKGPDFPTAATILGKSGIREAYETGTGKIVIRSKCEIVDDPYHSDGRQCIIIKEIPYAVNKKIMIEGMADLVKNKRIEGILDIRDESNREGIRIVIELRKEAVPEVILNQLYKYSSLESSFSINMLAIHEGQPKIFNLKEILNCYIDHQVEVIKRRVKFDLDKAIERQHILEGLHIASINIDEVIELIKNSKTSDEAQQGLQDKFLLSEKQSKAILEMKLQRLVGMEREKIEVEIRDLEQKIKEYNEILANHNKVIELMKIDLLEMKEKYGDDRKTIISNDVSSLDDEDLIPQEDVVLTLTTNGYVKRVPVDTYKAQNRGGRGIKGITTNSDDIVDKIVYANTHTDLLFFTSLGKVYRMRTHQIPEFSRQGKGIPIINLLQIEKGESVKSIISVQDYSKDNYLIFVTEQGIVKRVSLDNFERINKNGKIAIGLKDEDQLLDVKFTTGNEEIFIAASNGKLCRFNELDVRGMGRTASGVRGITLDGAKVIGITTSNEGDYILVVSSNGLGKMSQRDDYRLTKRGGKGVVTLKITEKTGDLVAMRAVNGDEDILITTTKGIIIRTSLAQVKIAGRNTQGVKVIKVDEDSKVANIAIVDKQEEVEQTDEEVKSSEE